MRAILAILTMLLLAACNKQSATESVDRYVGHWVEKGNGRSELDIVQRDGTNITIVWVQTYGSGTGRRQTRKSFDATLLEGKLVSQGFTTFIRDGGTLVFAQNEFVRSTPGAASAPAK